MKTLNHPRAMRSNESASAVAGPPMFNGLFQQHLRQPQNVIRLQLPIKSAGRAGDSESLIAWQSLASRQTQFWDSVLFGLLATCGVAGIVAAWLGIVFR